MPAAADCRLRRYPGNIGGVNLHDIEFAVSSIRYPCGHNPPITALKAFKAVPAISARISSVLLPGKHFGAFKYGLSGSHLAAKVRIRGMPGPARKRFLK